MGLNEYQKTVKKTAIYPTFGADFVYPALGLAGEAGEVVEKVKKLIRNDSGIITDRFRKEVKSELGDCMWYISILADCFGITLQEVADANIEKIFDRHARGVINSEGDNR